MIPFERKFSLVSTILYMHAWELKCTPREKYTCSYLEIWTRSYYKAHTSTYEFKLIQDNLLGQGCSCIP